jgi:hypothetical protein
LSRSPNANALAELQKRQGIEPIFIIEVDWTSTLTLTYADKEIYGIPGKILSASGLDAVVKVTGGASAVSIDIELLDGDESIKTIMDANDVHKRPVRIYQAFADLLEADKFLLFSGQIATPITWTERTRIITFTVESEVEDQEVGFSPEQGEFTFISDRAVSKAWPLCFGSPLRVPAVKITDDVRGTSLTRYGLITQSDLDSLCTKAATYATAITSKEALDLIAGATDANVQNAFEVLGSAASNLNLFLEALIIDSPTQEADLRAFVETCKDAQDATAQLVTDLPQITQSTADIPGLQATLNEANITLQNAINTGDPVTIAAAQIAQNAAQAALDDATAQLSAAEVSLALNEGNLTALNATKALQTTNLTQFVLTEIIVDGGDDFPQGTPVNIIINGAKFRGTFSGETFTISDATLPLHADVTLAPRESDNVNEFWITDNTINLKGQYCWFQKAIVYVDNQQSTRCFFTPVIFKLTGTFTEGSFQRNLYDFWRIDGQPLSTDKLLETSAMVLDKWITYLEAIDNPTYVDGRSLLRNQDYSIEIGDEVYLEGDYKDIWIANLIPSTEVKEVMAFRVIDGVRTLLPVPERYFAIDLNESIAGQNATTIRLVRPLTQYNDENWENQLYVSLTSSEGPNTADVIKYIVDTWMGLDSDTASFASVSTAIANYPSHFAVLNTENGLRLIEDIAFQARCAVFVKSGTVHIKYLSASETPVLTLTESEASRFVLEYTESQDLVTKLVAVWQDDYVQIDDEEQPHKLVLRNNIAKYGVIEREFNFNIYNELSLVQKSATFWLIRMSNTWKILNCEVALDILELETFDQVTLSFIDDLIATADVQGVVLDTSYESADNKITLRIQSPVQAGKTIAHPLFYPASAPGGQPYPTACDPFAGSSGDPVGFSPFDLAPVAWFDATQGVQETDGRVSQWTDLSGNGNHVTQATPGDRPVKTLLNGLDAILFDDEAEEWLDNTSWTAVTAAPAEVIVVIQMDEDTPTSEFVQMTDASTSVQFMALFRTPANPRWQVTDGGTSALPTGPALDPGTTHLVGGRSVSDSSHFVRMDGSDAAEDTTTVAPPGIDKLSIGRAGDASPGDYMSGYIMEVLIFNKILTYQERIDLENHLATKWGVTL